MNFLNLMEILFSSFIGKKVLKQYISISNMKDQNNFVFKQKYFSLAKKYC